MNSGGLAKDHDTFVIQNLCAAEDQASSHARFFRRQIDKALLIKRENLAQICQILEYAFVEGWF